MRRNTQLIDAFHTAQDFHDQTQLPARCAEAASKMWRHLENTDLKVDNGDGAEEVLAHIYAFYCRANGISPLAVLPGAIPYLGEKY